MPELPIVDLQMNGGGPPGELAGLAGELDRACRDTGFVLAVGHGLGPELGLVFEAARAFFDLPQEEKERIPRSSSFGYVPRSHQAIDRDRPTGVTEYLDLPLGPSPYRPAKLAPVAARYEAGAMAVADRLLAAMAVALDLDAGWFACRMTDPECKLRFLHYQPAGPDPDGSPPVPTGPHTDYGALTLLATDGSPGLEVRARGGAWTPVEAPPGALVVNVGDMLARWTNLRWASTRHRVVSGPGHRYSVPFFVNPDPTTVVDCLPSCVTVSEPCRFEPVTASAFLAGRIAKTIPEPFLDTGP